MKALFVAFVTALLGSTVASSLVALEPLPGDLVPRIEDETRMWWAEGFPGQVPSARWLRVIQTGTYAFALDTETLTIPHFGSVSGIDDDGWQSLPPARLSLEVEVDGKTYRPSGGGEWSRWGGPRLIESGRFFQRADVTDLQFLAGDGTRLNAEARFETAAWPDRLGLILAVRPGRKPILPGEASFGRVRGGFGLDGNNHFEVAAERVPESGQFTLALWAFLPTDYRVSEKTSPWLVCKNANEHADGNFGIVIGHGEEARARINLGGGKENAFVTEPVARRPLKLDAWNHLAMSYDGDMLRFFVNGGLAGECQIGRSRDPVPGGMSFGRRHDNWADGYHLRGVIDEIRLYDRALSLKDIRPLFNQPEVARPALEPKGEWTFRAEGKASTTQLRERWNRASMEIRLSQDDHEVSGRWQLTEDQAWTAADWQQVAVAFEPIPFRPVAKPCPIEVRATEIPGGKAREVTYEPSLGWHRINLDGIEPILPPGREVGDSAGTQDQRNDALERVRLVLSNPGDRERVARLMFEKTAGGIRQRIGTPITGISAILRDGEGNPTGIPVQLSKNWHRHPGAGPYEGQWFHGISQVRLPGASEIELEMTIAYGHWGGVPAASHAQLSLIGWGSNQLWDQSAIGSWGESLCIEPDQVQRGCSIMDVRPLMVASTKSGMPWGWTSNVGGGDYFALWDRSGDRRPHRAVRTTYHRQGPCLTEVTYSGRMGKEAEFSTTVSLGRTDDLVRAVYRLRLDVKEALDFSRFVVFQVGADNYNVSAERKMALGNEAGLVREWETKWGGDRYQTPSMECGGRIPWLSLHQAQPRGGEENAGAWANRGIVVRSWKARLGGEEAKPWVAERGLSGRRDHTSALDFVVPPDVVRLEPGDFVEATIEHLVVPQFAEDYYGSNQALAAALGEGGDTWRMVHREAVGNDRIVEMKTGELRSSHPAVSVEVEQGRAEFALSGGLGFVPITFRGLASPAGSSLLVDGHPLDQAIHGRDFWQTDYDPITGTWSRTYNLQVGLGQTRKIKLEPGEAPERISKNTPQRMNP